MSRIKGRFSDRVFTCLFLQTLTGRILGQGNEPVMVKEGNDVMLPCSLSTKENINFKMFDWKKDGQKYERDKEVFRYEGGLHYNNQPTNIQDPQFKGRVFHFKEELKHGNASIIIRNTNVNDSGDYTCAFPRLQPSQTFHIKLVVERILKRQNTSGAAPEPYVKVVQTADGMKLQCVVRGVSPELKVEWKDSSGNIVPAEEPKVTERGDIILQAPVTETDHYYCVVTQEEISHQIDSKIFVHISEGSEKNSSGTSTVWIIAVVFLSIVVIFVVVFFAILLCALKRKDIIGVNGEKGSDSNQPSPEERSQLKS